MKNRCCAKGCEKYAEFEILDTNEKRPELGNTYACEDHVGALLGSVHPTTATGPWTVFFIPDLELTTEKSVLNRMHCMCIESLSPESFEHWEIIKRELIKVRKYLKARGTI